MPVRFEITRGPKITRMPRIYSVPALEGQIQTHETNIRTLVEAIANEDRKIAGIRKMLRDMRQAEAD